MPAPFVSSVHKKGGWGNVVKGHQGKNQRYFLLGSRSEWAKALFLRIGHPLLWVTSSADLSQIDESKTLLLPHQELRVGKFSFDGSAFNRAPANGWILQELAECEQLYLAMLTRIFPSLSYEGRKAMFVETVSFWCALFKLKPSFVVFQNNPHEGYDYVCYALAKRFGVRTICTYNLPYIPKRSTLIYIHSDLSNHFASAFSSGRSTSKESLPSGGETRLQNDLQEWVSHIGKISSGQYTSFTRATESVKINGLLATRSLIYDVIDEISSRLFRDRSPKTQFDVDSFICGPNGSRFLYFPLHYQPECSSLPLGGEWHRQEFICEAVAACLPSDTVLVVKQHPRKSKPWSERESVLQIGRLHNVFLCPPEVPSSLLLERCQAIVTMSGTAGWEGILLNKPVIMFGSRIYEGSTSVLKPDNFVSLSRCLRESLSKSNSSHGLDAFLAEINRFVFPGVLSPKDLAFSTVADDVTAANWAERVSSAVTEDSNFSTLERS